MPVGVVVPVSEQSAGSAPPLFRVQAPNVRLELREGQGGRRRSAVRRRQRVGADAERIVQGALRIVVGGPGRIHVGVGRPQTYAGAGQGARVVHQPEGELVVRRFH